MRPVDLVGAPPAWLDGSGAESGIVLSSRVRLARNLVGTAFPHRADSLEASRDFDRITEAVSRCDSLGEASVFDFSSMDMRERRILVERHLASPRLERAQGSRGVVVGPAEIRAVMVNEEDHVRIQALASGLDLNTALQSVVELDRELEEELEYAACERWGYLTACPTNVGTGLRASAQLHLSGLVLAGEMKRVHRAVGEMGMAVRGWFGEGSRALGDLYQVSNQRTLGATEEESVEALERVVRRVLELESEARARLSEPGSGRRRLTDRICRSWATLRSARLLSDDQAMACLSDARVARWLGLLEIEERDLNRVSLLCLPAHLGEKEGEPLAGEEADSLRAKSLRAWARTFAEPTADDDI